MRPNRLVALLDHREVEIDVGVRTLDRQRPPRLAQGEDLLG